MRKLRIILVCILVGRISLIPWQIIAMSTIKNIKTPSVFMGFALMFLAVLQSQGVYLAYKIFNIEFNKEAFKLTRAINLIVIILLHYYMLPMMNDVGIMDFLFYVVVGVGGSYVGSFMLFEKITEFEEEGESDE